MTNASEGNRPVLKRGDREETTVGNYFVANYPPFSFWQQERVPDFVTRLGQAPANHTPFGLYVHIPFCRKRCDFCYFRVYTDKDSKAIRRYLDAVLREAETYAQHALVRGRKPRFIYFGGGTPSYLSVDQLTYLFEGLQQHFSWDATEEITFECEPGTLQERKIQALRELGVTRLSLGVENFDPEILELNNRAHRAAEIDRAYGFARAAGFEAINVDLIAGMVGETDENWADCIQKVRAMAPEAITIYQMEVPYNTTVYRRMRDGGEQRAPVADWATKRRWVKEAFAALEQDGYRIGSAYTAMKNDRVKFVYRDNLWRGADMLGMGVASFSHLGGVHAQNEHDFEQYVARAERGELPVHRALPLSDDERLIREFVLQTKLGTVDLAYFRDKFGVEPTERFADALEPLRRDGDLTIEGDTVQLTRDALLQIDLDLPAFFRPEHRDARYA